MTRWFSAAILAAALGVIMLAIAGALDWEPAFGALLVIVCGGQLIVELIARAHRDDGDDGPGLSARVVAGLILSLLAGVALTAWLG